VRRLMLCKIAIWVFVLLWAGATFIFATGTFGWFGQPQDPLSGVFLLPLGFPWILAIEIVPETAKPLFAVFAPSLTLAILVVFCRKMNGKIRRSR
jgi:hypothetical protein